MTGTKTVEELYVEIADLKDELKLSEDECGKHETEIEKLEKDIEELEETVSELENAPSTGPYVAVLERFADHRNWVDGRYAPVINEIDDHPADVAGRVLQENR
jgi:predicted nuclease with TOPRIM domain